MLYFQKGQSAIEFAMMSVVFVPMFVAAPILGKYIDIEQKTVESSRYAAWERTVWSDDSRGWNDGSGVNKTDEAIEAEIDQRFFGHPAQGIYDSNSTENSMWSTVTNGSKVKFLQGADFNASNNSSNVVRAKTEATVQNSKETLNQSIASGIPGASILSSSSFSNPLTSAINCETGVDFDQGLGLATDNKADMSVETPIKNALIGPEDLLYSANSGILSNAWSARDEEQLRDRVGRITMAEPVNCVTGPAALTLGTFSSGRNSALFGEVLNAYETKDTLNRYALPENRKGTDAIR